MSEGMKRRQFLRALGAGAATLAMPGRLRADGQSDRPNILVMLCDDMGWGQPGYQGGTRVPTPNLDRLAEDGVRLTQFYAQSVCSPTRACLLTGRYPFRNGMEERTHANDVAGMLLDERTLAEALKEAGYFTAITGKWHLGEWKKAHLPMQRGFDHQYGHYSALIDSFRHTREAVLDWHRNEQPLNEEGYSTYLIADEVESLLRQHNNSNPFFMYVPFNAVHGPHQAPREVLRKYKGRGRRQAAQLDCMDVAIGRILDALDENGYAENTLVIFFNDNGGPPLVGNAPYRGTKGEFYEGGVRVTCVMKWPGEISPGSKVDEPLHVVDLYPTLINLAGASLKQELPVDGLDAWPTVSRGRPSPRSEIVYNVPGAPRSSVPAIRQGNVKLVGEELYDVAKDPGEENDLADRYPDKVRKLQKRLDELAEQRRPPEEHRPIPGYPPAVYGKEENEPPLPDWLVKLAEENRRRAKKGR